MTKEQIETLASILSGPLVIIMSAELRMGDFRTELAKEFFHLRKLFGIHGNVNINQAEEMILLSLDDE